MLNGKIESRNENVLVEGNLENAGQLTTYGASIRVLKNLKNTSTGKMLIHGSKKIEDWTKRHPWYFLLISIVIGIVLDRSAQFLFAFLSKPEF